MLLLPVEAKRTRSVSINNGKASFLLVAAVALFGGIGSVDAAFHPTTTPRPLCASPLPSRGLSRVPQPASQLWNRNTKCGVSLPQKQANIHSPTSSAAQLRVSSSSNSDMTPNTSSSSTKTTRVTAVYTLILCNLGVFLADKVFRNPFVMRNMYLAHSRWSWWQPLTSCFCHADHGHLSNNLFLLLLFGRSVEDDLGWGGMLLSYVFCGVFASLVSLVLLPRATVSIGASGAVFGLFAVSTLSKLSWKELLDWRKLVEVAVLGEFVFRQLTSEISTAARGGIAGINHVAHLSGAAAGAIMVFGMRAMVANFERSEKDLCNYPL